MIVVSNSSPLIALARIGRLNLLASFYQQLLIPAEVEYEVTVAGHGLPGAEEVRNADWIEVAPQNSPVDPPLTQACLNLGGVSVALFSWPRASKPICCYWTSGKPVASRGTLVFR